MLYSAISFHYNVLYISYLIGIIFATFVKYFPRYGLIINEQGEAK